MAHDEQDESKGTKAETPGIGPGENSASTNAQVESASISQMQSTNTPTRKSEKDRMTEFFRGSSMEESEVILRGHCPACHKIGYTAEWLLVGIGYKKCSRCLWKDH